MYDRVAERAQLRRGRSVLRNAEMSTEGASQLGRRGCLLCPVVRTLGLNFVSIWVPAPESNPSDVMLVLLLLFVFIFLTIVY